MDEFPKCLRLLKHTVHYKFCKNKAITITIRTPDIRSLP